MTATVNSGGAATRECDNHRDQFAGAIMAFVKDKRVKLLAVTTPKRIAAFPGAPTLAEAGVPGSEAGAWHGLLVPTKTPRPVIDRLNAELNKALKDPEVLSRLAQQATEPLGGSPEEFAAYLDKELARWGAVVKATGVTLD
jgi:tripartite-type tricarboxylate transporter receptor subunit TctC